MIEHAVVIVGAGPTGLMLAGELALAGVDVAIVERRASQQLTGSRAGGLQSRTLEILDQRGIADRFVSKGQKAQVAGLAGVTFDISDFPTRHNYGLGLWQNHIERILAEWVAELAVTIYREREVTGFVQDDTGVDVELSNGESLRANYLVGCDGGRSLIRKAAGIDFPGWDPTTSALIAEVEMARQPELGIHRTALGVHAFGKLEYEIRDGKVVYKDGGPVRVMVTERHVGPTTEPTLGDLSEALIAVCGTDYGVHSPTWLSRFTDMTRQAATYRDRRALLAGDAAHVHAPDGGQGLNIGVQDAVNLGWKLAQVVKGTSPESLLDTYHAERHPVAARILRNTMASVALRRDAGRSRHSLQPRRRTPPTRTPHARSRPGHRQWPAATLHTAARRSPSASQPRRARRLQHHTMGRSGSVDRCEICGCVGASGPRGGHCSRRRVDPARRLCCLGGRPSPSRAA